MTEPAGKAVPAASLVEEFDSDRSFIQTSDNVYIEDGKVFWHIKRNEGVQYGYRKIPPFSGNVRLTVQGQVDSWTNNCGIFAGIGEKPDHRSGSISVHFGWNGGGCETNGTLIEVAGVSADDRSAADCNYTGNWLWIEPKTSYTATLEIRDGIGTLTAKGAGQNKGRVKYEGPYTILWVGATGRDDWPECTGVIERMVVEPLN